MLQGKTWKIEFMSRPGFPHPLPLREFCPPTSLVSSAPLGVPPRRNESKRIPDGSCDKVVFILCDTFTSALYWSVSATSLAIHELRTQGVLVGFVMAVFLLFLIWSVSNSEI